MSLFDSAGMSDLFGNDDEEEEFFFEGDKVHTSSKEFFDASMLPDAPTHQKNARGVEVFVLHIVCPTKQDLTDMMRMFTEGQRKGISGVTKEVTINAVARRKKDGKLWIDFWREKFEKGKKKVKADDDEAQIPF